MPTTVLDPIGERLLGAVPGAPATGSQCYLHAELGPEAVLSLVKAHSQDFRAVDALIAWADTPITPDDGEEGGHIYRVLGWTTTAILRGTLSQRLDALNPVAAFRLLDQPEIAVLDRSNRDYVVLLDAPRADRHVVSGAISADDIDLWCTNDPAELAHAIAVDLDTYCRRFAGTGVAA